MFSTISSFLITWWMRQTEPLNRLARFSSESLRVGGTRAVTGTSVNDGWWTGQAEPDGSSPSGSSVQCTCTNEDPEADTATMPLSLSLSVTLAWPVLTSCCKLFPADSGVSDCVLFYVSLPALVACLLCVCLCLCLHVSVCLMHLSPVLSRSRSLYPLKDHY